MKDNLFFINKDIDETTYNAFKKFEANLSILSWEDKKRSMPFFEKLAKLKKTDENSFFDLDLALKNRHIEKIQEITNKYDFYKEYMEFRNVEEYLYEEAVQTGSVEGYHDNYYTRMLDLDFKDDYMDWLKINESEVFNDLMFDVEVLRKESKVFSSDQEIKFINNFLRGFIPKDILLLVPNANLRKPRKALFVKPESNKFFLDSLKAGILYIERTRKDIEERRFFGKESKEKTELRNKLKRKYTQLANINEVPAGKIKSNEIYRLEIEKTTSKLNLDRFKNMLENSKIEDQINFTNLSYESKTEEFKNTIRDIELKIENINKNLDFVNNSNSFQIKNKRIKDIQTEIKDIEEELGNSEILENSIASYVREIPNLSMEQETLLKRAIQASISPAPTGKISSFLTNSSFAIALTSFRNAINQLPELANSFYKNGFFNTIEALSTSKKISLKELGIEDLAGEIKKDGFAYLDWVLKKTGFSKIDAFGKNTFLNAKLIQTKKLLNQNNKIINLEIEKVFGKQAEQVKENIAKENMTNEVKQYLFIKLAEIQPLTMSSHPLSYLENGGTRFLYTLKVYTLKQLNLMKTDIYDNLAKGNIKEGLTNLVKWQAFLLMVGAPIDIVMGLITGYDDDDDNLITDSMIDNILLFNILNRYTLSKASKGNIGDTAWDFVKPPVFGFGNDVVKDIINITTGKVEDLSKIGSIKYLPFGKDVKMLLKEDEKDNKKKNKEKYLQFGK